MKSCSDLIAHGLALSTAIVIVTLAMEVKRNVKTNSLELQQTQALKDLRQQGKDLRNDPTGRYTERRNRRKRLRQGKSESKLAS
jgi:hypothetical protein